MVRGSFSKREIYYGSGGKEELEAGPATDGLKSRYSGTERHRTWGKVRDEHKLQPE